MLLGACCPALQSWSVSILATDINPVFLARAREGLYGGWSFRETPDELRDRFWIEEQGALAAASGYPADGQLRAAEPGGAVLSRDHQWHMRVDIIVCRNVTIYFDEATTRQVVERFYDGTRARRVADRRPCRAAGQCVSPVRGA